MITKQMIEDYVRELQIGDSRRTLVSIQMTDVVIRGVRPNGEFFNDKSMEELYPKEMLAPFRKMYAFVRENVHLWVADGEKQDVPEYRTILMVCDNNMDLIIDELMFVDQYFEGDEEELILYTPDRRRIQFIKRGNCIAKKDDHFVGIESSNTAILPYEEV